MKNLKHIVFYIKKIIHIKLTILVLTLLPFVVFTLLTSKSNKIAGIQSFVVLTGSMEPAIQQGSLVFTKLQSSYAVGDVIAYKQGTVTVTHRVAQIIKENGSVSYQTWGDANSAPDSTLVTAKDVLGKAENKLPFVGSFILFLRTLEGFVALIIAPIVLYIIFELWNIKKELERSIERKLMEKMHLTSV
jgi:signal peptidase I